MNFKNVGKKPPKYKVRDRITAQLEFTQTGYLKTILLNAETDGDQRILEESLFRIINPGHLAWIKRLFRRE